MNGKTSKPPPKYIQVCLVFQLIIAVNHQPSASLISPIYWHLSHALNWFVRFIFYHRFKLLQFFKVFHCSLFRLKIEFLTRRTIMLTTSGFIYFKWPMSRVCMSSSAFIVQLFNHNLNFNPEHWRVVTPYVR